MAKRGESVLDLIEVMDRLRSPGGCPWDARQTHQSLVEYLVEEAYETVEAIEGGDDSGLREELGDLLLQVVFHARIAQERGDKGWDVDDVARGIVEKLIRRHPHVFADADADTAEQVEANWHALKAEEKGRASVADGIPAHLPALRQLAKEFPTKYTEACLAKLQTTFEGLHEAWADGTTKEFLRRPQSRKPLAISVVWVLCRLRSRTISIFRLQKHPRGTGNWPWPVGAFPTPVVR